MVNLAENTTSTWADTYPIIKRETKALEGKEMSSFIVASNGILVSFSYKVIHNLIPIQ